MELVDVRKIEADYGDLPDLSGVDADRDIVFVLNGTTSGVRVPDANWIHDERRATINTPSMLCVEDYLDALRWAEQLGGLAALITRRNGILASCRD